MKAVLFLILLNAALFAQSAPPDAKADEFYVSGRFDEAVAAYRAITEKNPKDVAAQAGLIRSLLAQDDFHQAHELGLKAHRANPSDAPIRALMGDIFFREADFDNSYRFYLAALDADNKCARAYWGLGRIYASDFRRKSARNAFIKAFELDPNDPNILRSYAFTVQKDEERMALLEKFLSIALNEDPRHISGVRDGLEFRKRADSSKQTELLSPYGPYKLKLQQMMHDPKSGTNGILLHVSLNGAKPVRLQLDTGASGVIVNHKAAERSGLQAISTSQMFGIGDEGSRNIQVAIADRLKVGDVEFANYPVEIAERKVLDDVDGLIGADVFSRFLVKLNIPNSVVELSPLPPYADGGTKWEEHDRELPEAGDFVAVRRLGHFLLVRTAVNEKRLAYFALDSGASLNLISEDFAREMTKVGKEDMIQLKGISGKVKDVYSAERIVLRFGHFRQENPGMVSYNMRSMNRSQGLEMGGLLGWPIVGQLITTINYRDGLIEFRHPNDAHKK